MSKKLLINNLLSRIKDIIPDPSAATTSQIDKAEDAVMLYIKYNFTDEEKVLIGMLLSLQNARAENRELVALRPEPKIEEITRSMKGVDNNPDLIQDSVSGPAKEKKIIKPYDN